MQTKEILQKSSDILLEIMAAFAALSVTILIAMTFLFAYISSF